MVTSIYNSLVLVTNLSTITTSLYSDVGTRRRLLISAGFEATGFALPKRVSGPVVAYALFRVLTTSLHRRKISQ